MPNPGGASTTSFLELDAAFGAAFDCCFAGLAAGLSVLALQACASLTALESSCLGRSMPSPAALAMARCPAGCSFFAFLPPLLCCEPCAAEDPLFSSLASARKPSMAARCVLCPEGSSLGACAAQSATFGPALACLLGAALAGWPAGMGSVCSTAPARRPRLPAWLSAALEPAAALPFPLAVPWPFCRAVLARLLAAGCAEEASFAPDLALPCCSEEASFEPDLALSCCPSNKIAWMPCLCLSSPRPAGFASDAGALRSCAAARRASVRALADPACRSGAASASASAALLLATGTAQGPPLA